MTAIALRAATSDDCEAVWRWNCAPEVRARSRAPGEVSLAEHATWYARRLASADPMWVVEADGVARGVVRIDDAAARGGRISIALGAEARGQGIGRRAIAAACRAWGRPIFAEILVDNLASRAAFEACGFRADGARGELVTYHWNPQDAGG